MWAFVIVTCPVRWPGFRDVLGLRIQHEAQTMAFVTVGGDGSQLALFQAEGDEPLRQPHHVAPSSV
jgi:hypothetical protein